MSSADIRAVVLTVIREQQLQLDRNASAGSLQQNLVLNEAAQRLGLSRSADDHQALLTLWSDLFRTGYLAWGLDLNNPNPPFFHATERGRRMLERLSRDPGNPAGYLSHLSANASLSPIPQSYVAEALECYVAGLFRAAAVMLGAAAESMALDLRDATLSGAAAAGLSAPKALGDMRIKKVLASLYDFLGSKSKSMGHELREDFEALWPAFTHQIRVTRNEAGHPKRVDTVSEDAVHGSFLIFPDLARTTSRLTEWVEKGLQ